MKASARWAMFAMASATSIVAACSSSSSNGGKTIVTVDLSKFDQSCKVDSDCVLASDGNLCGGCSGAESGCARTAINRADKTKYDDEAARLRGQCDPSYQRLECSGACAATLAYCNAGRCAGAPAWQLADAGIASDGAADASRDGSSNDGAADASSD